VAKKVGKHKTQEYDFALIADGVSELTEAVQDALFEAGCDDATLSIQHGLLYIEFSRAAESLKEAIVSAIRNVRGAGVGARLLRVDACNLVSASEIARRIGRTRQLVHQYITGARGPGGFPPPSCRLTEQGPLWAWCDVSRWLAEHNLLRAEESWNAEVVEAINTVLQAANKPREYSKLLAEIARELKPHAA
jgi:hypothetical protein